MREAAELDLPGFEDTRMLPVVSGESEVLGRERGNSTGLARRSDACDRRGRVLSWHSRSLRSNVVWTGLSAADAISIRGFLSTGWVAARFSGRATERRTPDSVGRRRTSPIGEEYGIC